MNDEEFEERYRIWKEGWQERRKDTHADELRAAVGKAIKEFVDYTTGGGYTVAWVAAADTTSPLLEQAHRSVCFPIAPGETSAAHIRGILSTAQESF